MSTLRHGNIKLAIRSLQTAKARSLLTLLGIIIGVMSVVCVICIGQGVKQQITGQIDHFGKDLITVRPGGPSTGLSDGPLLGDGLPLATSSLLTTNDLKTVQQTTGVRLAVPLGTMSDTVVGDNTIKSPLVIATGNDLPEAINQQVAYGGFLNSSDHSNVVVLGENLAQNLFDERVPLGRSLSYHGQTFIVVGIFDQFDTSLFSLSADFNNAMFIPFTTGQSLSGGGLGIYQILAKPGNSDTTTQVAQAVQRNLNNAHGGAQDTSVLTRENSMTTSNRIIHLLTLLTAGVAAIALIVGGVGIMDVMLVSVTERMHEIGLRKAIGATNRQILRQFITEAMVLSTSGAILGLLLSLATVLLLRIFTSLQPVIVWQAFVLGAVLSVAVGVIFGAAPALKAARKDPIEALRHE